MSTFDPTALDRDIARAARAERSWLRRLRSDPNAAGDEAWFAPVRWVTTKTTFSELPALGSGDALGEARRRWVFRLALARIGQPTLVEARRARSSMVQLEKPEVATIAASEIVHRALADAERERRAAWLEGLRPAGARVQAAERAAAEAEREIAARLGVPVPSALSSPYDQPTLELECRGLLSATEGLADELLGSCEDLTTLLGKLVCRDVSGSWPSHLHARWLHDRFAGSPLLEGTALDLGPLPALLGASTFARGLARFGAAWSRAASAHAGPYALAEDATDAQPLRAGALFASLLANPVFLARHLGFSRETARAVGRALAVPALAQIRLDATRTLHDLRALTPRDARDVLEHALKVRIAAELVGVLPRAADRAPVRAAASLLAAGDGAILRNRFDEDWFDNPHAQRALREEAALPPPLVVPKAALEGSADLYHAWIEALASA